MKSDFTRLTFDIQRHYSRVLLQQGRPMLDADFNEQTEILLNSHRRAVADIVGPHGAPDDLEFEAFKIIPVPDTTTQATDPVVKLKDLMIKKGSGRYYVDGLLCEYDEKIDTQGHPTVWTYLAQPHWPVRKNMPPRPEDLKNGLSMGAGNPHGRVLIYLDVWEHLRTWLDDGAMRDPALGGADTATRSQIVWQVRALGFQELQDGERAAFEDAATAAGTANDETADLTFIGLLKKKYQYRGSLVVSPKPGQPYGGCPHTTAEARYRGTENQLYRVEIHRAGQALPQTADQNARETALKGAATFKWSRENGSVAARWIKPDDCDGPNTLRAVGPRDQSHGFAAGQWVEILDEAVELRRETGVFVLLQKVEGDLLTVEDGQGALPKWEDLTAPKIRRWDQVDVGDKNFSEGAFVIQEEDTVSYDLDGIQIQFKAAPAHSVQSYRTGDYWIFAARTASGRIEWPTPAPGGPGTQTEKTAMPPYGITDHYAPLALLAPDNAVISVTALRRHFALLAKRTR